MAEPTRDAGSPPVELRGDVPLAPLTSLELGGPTRHFLDATDQETVREGLAWGAAEGLPVEMFGGGSNIVVADSGFDGLAIRMQTRGVLVERGTDETTVIVAAGEPWDELVAWSVAEGLAGLECLSGIPGTVGATPIQNVGAYGQEVAERITAVRALDRTTLDERLLFAGECGFAYRDSVFRRRPGRWVVLGVTFSLRPGGPPTLRYPELTRALAAGGVVPCLATVREAVLQLRRGKSMVVDPTDPNRRSVGSFFLNPLVTTDEADAVVARALATGATHDPSEVPRFAVDTNQVKLSAAWLVERAGFTRGLRRGPVGISSRHSLALVHHGAGTTADLLALAREVRDGVRARFGVDLRPEPTFLGFADDPLLREA